MFTRYARSLLILSAALAAPSALAADTGGGNDGGNCVSESSNPTAGCRPIEEFHLDPQSYRELKCYDGFQKRLEEIGKVMPDLADALKASFESKSLYHIDKEFDVLNADRTGLQFSTRQPAYQNDEEIFVSKLGEAGMSEKDARDNLLHEAVEAMQPVRNVGRVRTLTAALIAEPFDARAAQSAADRAQFGVFLTKAQAAFLQQEGRNRYLKELGDVLDNVNRACDSNAPLAKVEKLFDHAPGREKLPDHEPYAADSAFLSPLGSDHFYGLEMGMNPGKNDDAYDVILNDACIRHLSDVDACLPVLVGSATFRKNAPDANSKLPLATYNRLLARFGKGVERERLKLLLELAKTPAFLRILALHEGNSGFIDEARIPELRKDPEHAFLADVLSDVVGKRKLLNVRNAKTKRAMLCSDALDLSVKVSGMVIESPVGTPTAPATSSPASVVPAADGTDAQ